MKSSISRVAVIAFVLGLLCLQTSYSDEKAATDKNEGKTAGAAEKKPRLPNYYGKLNLTPEQREKVIAVQEKYGDQIAELRAKLQKLQAEQKEAIRALLDEDQQKMLAKLEDQAAKRREARAAANGQSAKTNNPSTNTKPAANGSEKIEGKKERDDK